MARKRLTQFFPFLVPLRVWQKNFCDQMKMRLDGNTYAQEVLEELPYEVSCTKTLMINEQSGYPIIYQENKVDNLKIASSAMNRIVIRPKEVFSFCFLLRKTKHRGDYKEGLILIDGKIVAKKGGGLCHLSNMLYYLFLMSPLSIVERHGHKVKPLPNPDREALQGIDATISSGWLDLKVRNDTEHTYQIDISFDSEFMYGRILSDCFSPIEYRIVNRDFHYFKKQGKIYESVSVVREEIDKKTKEVISSYPLYDEVVEVTYSLSEEIEIKEELE